MQRVVAAHTWKQNLHESVICEDLGRGTPHLHQLLAQRSQPHAAAVLPLDHLPGGLARGDDDSQWNMVVSLLKMGSALICKGCPHAVPIEHHRNSVRQKMNVVSKVSDQHRKIINPLLTHSGCLARELNRNDGDLRITFHPITVY